MENVTHTLLGAALAKTSLGKASPYAPAALVIAANLPDFENAVLAFYDQPTNAIHHRGITHSILGVLILTPLLTLIIRSLERTFARGRPRGSPVGLLIGVFLATASHLLLDWFNTYGVRPWQPFDATWHHGDLVFIADPWLWLLLGGAVCLAGRRTIAGSVALAILGLITLVIILLATDFTPIALQIAWIVGVPLLIIGRWRGFGRRHANAVVSATLVVCTLYVGFLGWSGRRAWQMSQPAIAAQLPPGENIIARTLSPQPADPLRWQIVAETNRAVYRHTFSIADSPTGVVRLPKHLDDPLVRAIADTPEAHAWRVFSRHPIAVITTNGHGRRIYLMDARYPMFPPRGFASFVIDVPGDPSASGS